MYSLNVFNDASNEKSEAWGGANAGAETVLEKQPLLLSLLCSCFLKQVVRFLKHILVSWLQQQLKSLCVCLKTFIINDFPTFELQVNGSHGSDHKEQIKTISLTLYAFWILHCRSLHCCHLPYLWKELILLTGVSVIESCFGRPPSSKGRYPFIVIPWWFF